MVAFTEDLESDVAIGQAFNPSPEQLALMPLFHEGVVPRYLFRLHCTRSAGNTNTNSVSSPACEGQTSPTDILRQDVFALDAEDAAGRLKDHLRWTRNHENPSNFMSWTSSLLFALQYGIYRQYEAKDALPLSDLRLLILDTKRLSPSYFIKDLEILDVFASNNSDLKTLHVWRKGSYYFGEYLTQGFLRIQGHCTQVNLAQLQQLGLFTMLPELERQQDNKSLAKNVVGFRQSFLAVPRPPSTHKEIRRAITIAQGAFGDHWAIPFSLMLLGLKSRILGDRVITEAFKAMFSTEEITDALEAINVNSTRLPEVKEFENLVSGVQESIGFTLEHGFERLAIQA